MPYVYEIKQVDELVDGGIQATVHFWASVVDRTRGVSPVLVEDFIIQGFVEDDWDIVWQRVDAVDELGNVRIDPDTGAPRNAYIEVRRTPRKVNVYDHLKTLIDGYAVKWSNEKRSGIHIDYAREIIAPEQHSAMVRDLKTRVSDDRRREVLR